jgi:hypothetical protein
MYRIIADKDDMLHTTWFQKMRERDSNGVNTRTATGSLNVLPPGQSKTDFRNFFFSQREVKKWNNLPDSVNQAETVKNFQEQVR